MRELTFNVFLDMHTFHSQKVIRVKKGDTKNKLVVTLTEHNRPYVISEGAYALFVAKKPDGNGVVDDCKIVDNTIEYTLTGQVTACEGEVLCELRLYDENDELLTSPRFSTLVDDTIFSFIEDNIESAWDLGALDRLIIEGNELVDELDPAIERANEASAKVNKYLKLTDLEKVVGASAYEIAVSNGYEGTEEEWLESLGKDPNLIRYGESDGSIEIGETAKTVTPDSIAAGANSVAGCRGYYISAIDFTNKHIYLAKEKTADPVITTGDEYYDETFETPAYLDGTLPQTSEITEDNPISNYFSIIEEPDADCGFNYNHVWGYYPAYVDLTALYNCVVSISGSVEDEESDGVIVTRVNGETEWIIPTSTVRQVSLNAGDVLRVKASFGTTYVYFHQITPADASNAVEFCIINGKHYAFCGEIASVDHNKITYADALPFGNIVASEDSYRENLDDHIFYVPAKAHIGSVDSVFTNAVVIGTENIAAGANGFVAGLQNILGGNHGFIVGRNNKGGYACIVGGTDNDSSGVTSTTFGRDNINKGWCCYVEGRSNTMPAPTSLREDGYPLNNLYNHLEGHSNEVDGGNLNHLEGQKNKSTGNYGHVENYNNTDNGEMNHTEGTENTNNGEVCHVGGWKNTDNGRHNYTTGYNNTNNGERGLVGGYGNAVEKGEQANAYGNAVFGARNTVKGALHFTTGSDHEIDSAGRVFAWGRGNISKAPVQQVGGQYNEQNDSALMVIGNGTSATKRSNAFEVYKTHTKAKAVTNTESCVRNILIGTELPDDSVGNDGDIYIMYEE